MPPNPHTSRIYLFRHGEVEERLQKRFRGRLDPGLSENGKRMSEANIAFLVAEKIDWIITTGLIRTDYIGKHIALLGIRHVVDRNFREADFGEWEGKNWDEVSRNLPEESRIYKENLMGLRFPGGESMAGVRDRIVEAWKELLRQAFRKVAIIGHSTSNACLMAYLKVIPAEQVGMQIIGSMHEIHAVDGIPHIVRENVVFY